MAAVVDLRNQAFAPEPRPVLLDPSGRRARVLAWSFRAMALLLLVWILALGLAGLGVIPAGDVPLSPGSVGEAPSPVRALPRPMPPSRWDLMPARPLAAGIGGAHQGALGARKSA